MTELVNDLDTPSDAELISRVRGGDVAAYGMLFSRHRDAANRLARQLVRGLDADDLVSESFAKVLVVLQGGGGPDVSFRAYLLTAVRRLHVDRLRSAKHLHTTDDLTPFDPGVPFRDTAVAGFETGAAAKAFASLPERWQLVLWHLEVEGQKPADIAPLLGMSPNSVSALAYRAREGLRQAFLTMHLSDTSEADCRWVNEHLGAYVRKGLARRDTVKVQAHLDGCRRCTAMHLELTEVNSNLSAIIAPLLLGSAAVGYLSSVSGSGGALGVLTLVSRTKELVAANTGGVVAGAVSVGVAAAAVVTLALTQSPDGPSEVVADPSVARTTTVPSGDGAGPTVGAGAGSLRSTSVTPSARPGASRSPSAAPTPPVPTTSAPPVTAAPTGPLVQPSVGALVRTAAPSATTGAGGLAPTTAATGGPPNGGPTGGNGGPTGGPTTSPGTPGGVGLPTLGTPVVTADGTLTVTAAALRAGDVLEVTLQSGETTFADPQPDRTAAGCVVVAPRRVRCSSSDPVDDLTVSLHLDYPAWMVEDDLTVASDVDGAAAGGAVTATFHPSRTPSFDFTAPVVDPDVSHTLVGDVDRYDVVTTAVLPPRVRGLVYTLGAGARFRPADAAPCSVADDGATMTCPDVRAGDRVDVPLAATSLTVATPVALSVGPHGDFDDPDPTPATTEITLRPGVDLALADLDPDNESPGNDDDEHLVTTRLDGARAGLSRVRYALTGAATFVGADVPGCTVADPPDRRTLACVDPADGPVTFTVRAVDPRTDTAVSISVAAAAPFEELDGTDNSDRARLTARPTYDFSVGGLAQAGQRLTGDTDTFALRATLGAVPDGLDELSLRVSGGDVEGHPAGCRVSGDLVTCTDLASARTVDLVVSSRATVAHRVGLTVEPPRRYDDPDPANDSATLTVTPGVHLRLAALTPADPVPTGDTYRVGGVLTGVRGGPVAFEVTSGDATLVGSSCGAPEAGDPVRVVCPDPANGRTVLLDLRPTNPSASTPVTVTARAVDQVQLDGTGEADNSATTTLSPDVALSSLRVTGHRPDTRRLTVRAQVSGAPSTMGALRIRVSGPAVADRSVHFTDGAAGADGEGDVNCRTTDASGAPAEIGSYVSCTGVGSAAGGAFFVDMRLEHRHGSSSALTFTLLPVDVDEGPHGDNDAGDLTVR